MKIKYFKLKIILILALLCISKNLYADKTYFDLSQDEINIKTNFTGQELILFGIVEQGNDAIVELNANYGELYPDAIFESLMSLKRAGANAIVTYFAEKIAERLSMPTTGASDAHKLSDIGTYATNFFDTVTDLDSFIVAIKSGRFNGTTFRKPASQV